MSDFLRSIQGPLITVVGLLVVFAIVALFVKRVPGMAIYHETINRIWWGLSVLVVAVFLWFLMTFTVVNQTPRSTIDRSITEEQTDSFKERHQPKKSE